MKAIFKKEILSYFYSPIGYIILAIFWAFSGFYFYMSSLVSNSASLYYVFNDLFIISIVFVPILTMKSFSEEKKQKTDQALLTAPINLNKIVFAKFLSCSFIFLLAILITFIYALIINIFTTPAWTIILGNFLGLFMLGTSLISVGIFVSSLTESQIISAISTFAIGIFIMLTDSLAKILPIEILSDILQKFSFMSHYKNFTLGILNLCDIVFFISISFIFIVLTNKSLERKR